ncbi:hypothetical protein [Embleya sp. NPDC005971]|uniref:hypothetical protein n=1 Tax=Embleya sp. NPDC005971 TaxID=3156724 RepID=UPI0033E95056
MTRDNARKAAVRARMAATGEPYNVAARAVDQDQTADQADPHPAARQPTDTNPPAWTLAPTEAEALLGITAEELGIRALPADATPQQRAHAEAKWRSADVDQPCRCSGDCTHGIPCDADLDDGDRCRGRLVHVDRYPGSMWGVIEWWDVHECDTCGDRYGNGVRLPAIPFGERRADGVTVIYDGVRHPNFPDIDVDDPGIERCSSCDGDNAPECDDCRIHDDPDEDYDDELDEYEVYG